VDRSQKEAVVASVSERMERAKAVILTDFSGLKVDQMTELRQQLRDKDLEYIVIKNRLFKRAIEGKDAEVMADQLTGPNGFGFAYEEPVDLAKTLVDFAKDNPKLEIKGGFLEGQALDAAGVEALSKLPGREQLLAMFLGALNGVPRNFVSVLAQIPRSFLNVLKAIEEEKGEES
jgi:large subunit ribosomal protein L10